jgi:hypothetical protein
MPNTTEAGGAVATNPARNRATAPTPQPQPTLIRRQTVGATLTLPPHPQPPLTHRNQRTRQPGAAGDQDLVLDVNQPPATSPGSAAEADRDGELALEATAARLHREFAEAEPTDRTPEEPEPLGRRLPVPLTGREGVER